MMHRLWQWTAGAAIASASAAGMWVGWSRIQRWHAPPLVRLELINSPNELNPDRLFVSARELANGPVHRAVRLWPRDGGPLRLEQCTASRTGLAVEQLDGSATAPWQTVRVTIAPVESTGDEAAIEGNIVLQTNDPSQQTVSLPVSIGFE